MASILLTGCGERKFETFVWGNLRNLGPNINSIGKDEHVTFTQDGETMYFASVRDGGMGGYDIYVSRFEHGEWTKAELLPAPVNTERDEFDVSVTPDGEKLFFASNRHNEDPYWNCDIYVAEWNGERWREPLPYNDAFITPNRPDWGVTFTKDFKTAIFSSGREPAKEGMVQIFRSARQEGRWSEPELLPEPVNSGGWEATPYLIPDGKTLYLNSGRGRPDKRDVDLWKFELIDGKWKNAELMDGPFKSNQHDYDPCVSPDGNLFYFTSTREGGSGGADIWVVEKVYRKPPEHAAFLRETLHLDFTHPVFEEIISGVTDAGMTLERKLEILYYFTRDSLTFVPDGSLFASEALEKRKAICYAKAMVFVSFCRRLGVPARLAWAEFFFPGKTRPHLHGIAKIFHHGKWIYIDTVSNREAWSYWDRDNAAIFVAPVFNLIHDVFVDRAFLTDVNCGDYETNDVPESWLQSMRSFNETGMWQ